MQEITANVSVWDKWASYRVMIPAKFSGSFSWEFESEQDLIEFCRFYHLAVKEYQQNAQILTEMQLRETLGYKIE
jgi:hypothetical protein